MTKKLMVAVLTTSAAIALLSCSDSIAPRDEAKKETFDGLVRNPATDMQALPPMEVDLSAAPGTVTVARYGIDVGKLRQRRSVFA